MKIQTTLRQKVAVYPYGCWKWRFESKKRLEDKFVLWHLHGNNRKMKKYQPEFFSLHKKIFFVPYKVTKAIQTSSHREFASGQNVTFPQKTGSEAESSSFLLEKCL